ncbi:MAG: hypothetical protein JXA20_20585 [Spirochaetes bacterium]|nr:hypothetical protein [Spirochaetota bacterium]
MASIILHILIFLTLLLPSWYFILRLFGRITGSDMVSALPLIGTAKGTEEGPARILILAASAVYLMAFTIFFVILVMLPKRVYYMNRYHAGGLLGYNRGFQVRLYDPSQRGYVDYPVYFSPLPAERFTEAFNVVLLYKDPGDDYYQTTELVNLGFNLTGVIAGLVLLVLAYMMLFAAAKQEGRRELSHRGIAGQFKKATGMPLWAPLLIFLSLCALLLGFSAVSVKRLMNRYSWLYEQHGKALREALLRRVSPRDTLQGDVIRRFKTQESDTETEEGADGRRTRLETSYYYMYHYTVEFRDLIRIPVYITLTLHQGSDEVRLLERHFPYAWKPVPDYARRYTFTVNPDYSISLKGASP